METDEGLAMGAIGGGVLHVEELRRYLGRRVRLSFDDGFVVEATLLSIEPEHVGKEVVYDPHEVIDGGTQEREWPAGAILVDSLDRLLDCVAAR